MNLRLAIMIAKRYIFSKKSTNVIHILSYIAMGGMAVGAMALVILLSVFNGFEGLVSSLYNVFHADVKILPAEGKAFFPDPEKIKQIEALDYVQGLTYTIEENAYFKYGDEEHVGIIKGVEENYADISNIDSFVNYGDYDVSNNEVPFCVVGSGIDMSLNLDVNNPHKGITVFIPKRGKRTYLSPEQAFNRRLIYPQGVFMIQQDFDEKYMLAPLSFVRNILSYEEEVGAIELKLNDSYDLDKAREEVAAIMGEEYDVKDRYMQNQMLYNIMEMERWMVVVIISFIMMIFAFMIISSLYMLVLEKKKDIAILKAMGATKKFIRVLFLLEGMFTSTIGAGIGIILAIIIIILQKTVGIIKLPPGQYVIKAYPVELEAFDLVLTFAVVFLISVVASYYPASRAADLDGSYRQE